MSGLDPYLNSEPSYDEQELLTAVLKKAHQKVSTDQEYVESELILNSEWMRERTREIQEQAFTDTKTRIIQVIEEHAVSILDEDQLVLIEDIIEKINKHQL